MLRIMFLLTIDTLKENSIKDHLLLPIVSLELVEDKYISWGATVSDKKGNYFYTSFPQRGFIVPYLILKMEFPFSLAILLFK